MALRVGLPLVANVGWGLALLLVFPKLAYPLRPTMLIVPDLGYLVVASGLAALIWGVLRTVLVYVALRRRDESRARTSFSAGGHRSASRKVSKRGDREETSSHRILRPGMRPHLVGCSRYCGFAAARPRRPFGPALAVIIMAAVLSGRFGVKALRPETCILA